MSLEKPKLCAFFPNFPMGKPIFRTPRRSRAQTIPLGRGDKSPSGAILALGIVGKCTGNVKNNNGVHRKIKNKKRCREKIINKILVGEN